MPPAITAEKITLNYPIFAAEFLNADHLVVAGGGGEGNSGVGNKITLLDVSESRSSPDGVNTGPVRIREVTEHLLSRSEDSVMSLAISHPTALLSPASSVTARVPRKKSSRSSPSSENPDPTFPRDTLLIAGINSSEASLKAGKNEHFRTFSLSSASNEVNIVPKDRAELFTPSNNADIYQRLLRARNGIAALASGGGTATHPFYELVCVSTNLGSSYPILRRITLEKKEPKDLDLDEDGNLVYATEKELFITPIQSSDEPKCIAKLTPGAIRAVRFLGPSRVLVVLNHPGRTGTEILIISTETGAIIKRHFLRKSVKAGSALDAILLSPTTAVAAISGSDQSVQLLSIKFSSSGLNCRIKTVRHFHLVHPFQITKAVFSPCPPLPSTATSSNVDSNNPSPSGDDNDDDNRTAHASIRLATTSMGNTVVVHTIPLLPTSTGWEVLRAGSVMRWTLVSLLASMLTVVLFAAFLQVVLVKRGGFDVAGLAELKMKGWKDVKAGVGEGIGYVEERLKERFGDADQALKAGMAAGAEGNDWEGEGERVVEEIVQRTKTVVVEVPKQSSWGEGGVERDEL